MVMLRRIALAAFLAIGFLAGLPLLLHAQTPIPGEPDTERRTRYTATAQTGPFAVGFDLYGDGTDYQNWVEVYVGGVKVTQSGNWTMGSVSGSFSTLARPITNATITFTVAQTGTVDIVGARRPRRVSQFQESQPVTARSQNQVLTDLWMTMRERWDRIPRTILAPPGEIIGPLPSAAVRASSALGFDPSGNPIAISPYLGSGTMIGPNVAIDGHVVCFNGTGGQLAKDCGAGIGTVLSVSFSLPGIFTVTGSPVTSTGTLTAALATQSANTLWAGPATGAAAAPAFRALVGADLPNPSTSSLGGVQSKSCLTSAWVNAISTSGVPGCTTPAFSDISGTATNAQLATMPAATFKGNPTGSTATPTDFTIQGLTARGAPNATDDKIPIYDNAAGTLKYVTPSDIAASVTTGVSTWNGRVGNVVPATNDYSLSQISGTATTTQGGVGRNASADAANTVSVANGAGSTVATAIFSLLNSACATSAARPACVYFMGRADPEWWGAAGDGVTNDQAAIQNAINYVNTSFAGGTVYFHAGHTYIIGSTLTLKGGVKLVGGARFETIIQTSGDFEALYFDNTAQYSGIDNLFIVCSQSLSSTANCVEVTTGRPVNIYNSNIWGGATAFKTAGVDGTIFNANIMSAATSGIGIQSSGANWYERVIIDNPVVASSLAGFSQGASVVGLAENHFINCDFSGNYTYSMLIADTSNATAVTVVVGGVFSSPLSVVAAKATILSAMEFNSSITANSSGPLIISGSYSFSAVTVTGTAPRSCAANASITC